MFITYVYDFKLEYIHIYHNLSHSTNTSNHQDDSLLTFQICSLTFITRKNNFCMESYYSVHASHDNTPDKSEKCMSNRPLCQHSSQGQSKVSYRISVIIYLIFS